MHDILPSYLSLHFEWLLADLLMKVKYPVSDLVTFPVFSFGKVISLPGTEFKGKDRIGKSGEK